MKLITANITAADQERAAKELRALLGEVRITMRRAIPQLTRFGVQSARKATPLARLRKVRAVTWRGEKGRKRRLAARALGEDAKMPWWAKYAVEYVSGGLVTTRYFRYRSAMLNHRVPEQKGLARFAWTKGLGKLPQHPGTNLAADLSGVPLEKINANAERTSTAEYYQDADSVRAGVTNMLRYMDTIAPNAVTIGTTNAMRRMRGMLERRIMQHNAKRIK